MQKSAQFSTPMLKVVTFLIVACVMIIYTTNSVISQPTSRVQRVAWSPDGSKIAVSYEKGSVSIFYVNDPENFITFPAHSASIYELKWSNDGRYIATGGASPDNALRVWNATTGSLVFEQLEVGVDVIGIVWSFDSTKVLAVAAEPFREPRNAVLVNLGSDQVISMHLGIVSDGIWNADETLVLAGIFGVVIYNSITFEPISQYDFDPANNQPLHLDISANGNLIAVGTLSDEIVLWKAEEQYPAATFGGVVDGQKYNRAVWINALRFSTDGSTIMTVTGSGALRTWDVASGQLTHEEQIPYYNDAADFSPCGEQIALGLTIVDFATLNEDADPFIPFGIRIVDINMATER